VAKKTKKNKPTFKVEKKKNAIVITHIKCGQQVRAKKISFPLEDHPKIFYILECPTKGCMNSGFLTFSDHGYRIFRRQLRELKSKEKAIIRRDYISKSPTHEVKIFSRILEIFEKE